MLSKTAERKPSPRVVIEEAAGSFSTGIIEAQVTSASRKIEPLKAPGRSFQSGWRITAAVRRAIQTAVPITGKWSRTSLKYRLATTFATIAAIRIQNTIASRAQSTCTDSAESFMIGWKACCCLAAKYAKNAVAAKAATYASSTASGLTPSIHIIVVVVSPTTLPDPPALDAA